MNMLVNFAYKIIQSIQFRYKSNLLKFRIYKIRKKCRTKEDFLNDLKLSIDNKCGFAVGKIGISEQHWMYNKIFLDRSISNNQYDSFYNDLIFHFFNQEGLFPATNDFINIYNSFFLEHINNIDYLGLFYFRFEPDLIVSYGLNNNLIYFGELEPDRSIPSAPSKCYLHYFTSKKILIVCPFANLLKDRANKEIFEAVWSKTGKKWFYPSSVESIEFPYGFSSETHRIFGDALKLYLYITNEIKQRDFDIALVAAGGLSIPIVSFIKNLGKIGIELGGHLQVLFGVLGKRWKEREDWKEMYFNNSWIDMPENYKPVELKNGISVCDDGAYW